METIGLGKYVELAYEIFVVSGGEAHSVFRFSAERPDSFIFGEEQAIIAGFTQNIAGLKAGDKFDFTLEPKDAFGEPDPEMIMELDKNIFLVDGEFDDERVYEGAIVPMLNEAGGRVDGRVVKVTADKVTLDFNHQLAGETVKYVGEVVSVREATDADRAPHHCKGCGSGDGEGCNGCGGNNDKSGGCSGCNGKCE